ncbi:Phytochrome-like protein cph2 [compost metagenome]
MEETQLDPQYLELELTETVAMDHALNVIDTIQQLKDLGVTVSIDDFGTGYSSLSYLTRFPIDNLKIDRSFIYNMHENPDSLAIVSAIAAMSHSLKLKIIVEGVETHEHLSYVQELKCHMGQGYLFSKPLPSKEMERLLAENFSFAVGNGEISA